MAKSFGGLVLHLDQVVRSTQRLAAGAAFFSKGTSQSGTAHSADGPPLGTRIFSLKNKENMNAEYVDEIVKVGLLWVLGGWGCVWSGRRTTGGESGFVK